MRNLQHVREIKKQLAEQRVPTIVLVGRAQQGKSSLINCVAGTCLARIGDQLAAESTMTGKPSVQVCKLYCTYGTGGACMGMCVYVVRVCTTFVVRLLLFV